MRAMLLGFCGVSLGGCSLFFLPKCGDGFFQEKRGEECDDNNSQNGDGCDSDCKFEFCGDGLINNKTETCDDSNTTAGDGCAPDCLIEVPANQCADGVGGIGEICYPGLVLGFGNFTGLISADLDQDGDLDFAAADVKDNLIRIFLQEGSGVFVEGTPLPTGQEPVHLISAELSGDNLPELVSVNFTSDNISVFLNLGSGLFSNASNVSTGLGSAPIAVLAEDLNGDSLLDLVVALSGTGQIAILNNEGGVFPSIEFVGAGAATDEPASLVDLDIDGDGDLDLIVANKGNSANGLRVLTNNGGVFQLEPTPIGTGAFVFVETGGFDGSAPPDLVALDSQSVKLFSGDGSGSFFGGASVDIGTNPHSLVVANLDGDPNLDLVVSNTGSSDVTVLSGDGDGDFPKVESFPVGQEPFFSVVEDLNEDGRLDVITANRNITGTGSLSLLLGGQDEKLQSVFLTEIRAPTFLLSDDSGVLTFASGLSPEETIFFESNQDGTFGPKDVVKPGIVVGAAFADLTGNSLSDAVLVTGQPLAINAFIFEQVSTGSFNLLGNVGFGAGQTPSSVVTGDFNADNLQDILIGDSTSGQPLQLFFQDGNGAFSANSTVLLPANVDVVSVLAGDFAQDSKADFAVVDGGLRQIVLFLNDTNQSNVPTFNPGQNIPLNNIPRAAVLKDIDNDQNLDLVVLTVGGIESFLGDGTGNFTPLVDFLIGSGLTALAVEDLNQDALPEIIVTDTDTDTVQIFINLKGEAFASSPLSFVVGDNPSAVSLRDFTQDGVVDLILANQDSNSIGVLPFFP